MAKHEPTIVRLGELGKPLESVLARFPKLKGISVAWGRQNGVGLILAATGVSYLRFVGTN